MNVEAPHLLLALEITLCRLGIKEQRNSHILAIVLTDSLERTTASSLLVHNRQTSILWHPFTRQTNILSPFFSLGWGPLRPSLHPLRRHLHRRRLPHSPAARDQPHTPPRDRGRGRGQIQVKGRDEKEWDWRDLECVWRENKGREGRGKGSVNKRYVRLD